MKLPFSEKSSRAVRTRVTAFTARAREIAEELSGADIAARARELASRGADLPSVPASEQNAKPVVTEAELTVLRQLREINLSELTPRAAIDLLYGIQETL